MTSRGADILRAALAAFAILFSLLTGLYFGEHVGEKVAVARIESQAREYAEQVAALQCDIAALTDRIIDLSQAAAIEIGMERPGTARVILTPAIGK